MTQEPIIQATDLSPEEYQQHAHWMAQAIEQARLAEEIGEVPIGCVIVQGDDVIASGYNLKECTHRSVAHAELLAIESANQTLAAWRIPEATLYVTLEPCAMCAGAMLNARIDTVVYGARDPKSGCAGTLCNLLTDERFNHRARVIQGVCEDECSALLTNFFRALRQKRKQQKLTEALSTSCGQLVDNPVDK